MPEGGRRRDRPESANEGRYAAHVRPEPTMHREPEVLVDAVTDVVARHVLHNPRAEDADAVERPAGQQHLIEGRQRRGRGVAAAAWYAGLAERRLVDALGGRGGRVRTKRHGTA